MTLLEAYQIMSVAVRDHPELRKPEDEAYSVYARRVKKLLKGLPWQESEKIRKAAKVVQQESASLKGISQAMKIYRISPAGRKASAKGLASKKRGPLGPRRRLAASKPRRGRPPVGPAKKAKVKKKARKR